VFFTIALHLQLVVGPDALQTGIRMLPISVAMFVTSSCGGLLSSRWPVRTIVRTGLTNGFINSAEESEVPGLDPPPLPN
jgi:hypothetical protein